MKLVQLQKIYRINKSELPEEDKMTEMVACLSGKSTEEVEELLLPDFNKLASQVRDALANEIPVQKPKKVICGHGITYEPSKLNRGQYITVNHFMGKDVIENAHLILASISYNPKTGKHEDEKHEEIAKDFLEADMTDVLAACVFFCQLFESFIKSLRSYLVKESTWKMSLKQREAMTVLMKDLAGFTMLSRSQTSKV